MERPSKERQSRRQGIWTFAASAIASSMLLSVSKVPWTGYGGGHLSTCLDGPMPFHLKLLCDVAQSLPLGEIVTRGQIGILLGVFGLANASSYLVWTILRGLGRSISTITASACSCFALIAWVEQQPREYALVSLYFSGLAILAVSLWISPIVRSHKTHFAYAFPAWLLAALTIFLDLEGGIFLLGSLALGHSVYWIGTMLRLGGAFPLSTRGRTVTKRIIVVTVIAAIEVLFCWLWIGPQESVLSTRIPHGTNAFASIQRISTWVPEQIVYPGIAFVALLVAPLRWRGSWLLALAFVSLFLISSSPRLPGFPATIAVTICAACGWIWMTARIGPAHWTNQALALGGAAAIASLLGMPGEEGRGSWWLDVPLANERCTHSIQRQVVRSLAAPGDVTLLHDPSLLSELRREQAIDGTRPDVLIIDARILHDENLSAQTMEWASQNRRILSDSFTLGGRWRATWATDAGPLFWFLFSAATPTIDELFDLPDAPSNSQDCRYHSDDDQAERWIRMNLERARFRRALGLDVSAITALPLTSTRRNALRTALQSAQALRVSTDRNSELELNADAFKLTEQNSLQIPAIAEAGDILFSNGDHQLGSRLLAEAAKAGFHPAWQALVRWQLRAGLDEAAQLSETELNRQKSLHQQSLNLFSWLVRVKRLEDALDHGRNLPDQSIDPAHETGIRLRLLQSLAHFRPADKLADRSNSARTSKSKE